LLPRSFFGKKVCPSIGKRNVAAPKFLLSKYWPKASGRDLKIIAFLFPHREDIGRLDQFWWSSVDEFGKRTGIEFLPNFDLMNPRRFFGKPA